MTRDDLWAVYVKKNPSFETTGYVFSKAGLRKFFDTTYDQAFTDGLRNGKAMSKEPNTPDNPLKSFFEGLK